MSLLYYNCLDPQPGTVNTGSVMQMPQTPERPLLHIGAGNHHAPGWINCDMFAAPNIDCVFNLTQPWPFVDDSIDGIYGSHVLEHLADHQTFFREAWRVMGNRRLMRLRVPYGGHSYAWADPTHVRAWYPSSFAHLQPGYAQMTSNPQHLYLGAYFIVDMVSIKITRWVREACRWRWVFHKLIDWFERFNEAFDEIWVDLYTVKTEEDYVYWKETRGGHAFPRRYVMTQEDYELWKEGEHPEVLTMFDVTRPNVGYAF